MNYLFFAIIFLFISCSNSHKEYTIQEFMDITSYGGSSFSYDEKKILIRSNQSGVFNAYEVNLETQNLKQLTFSDSNSISPISYFPNDNRFLFRSDQGGNEIWHIYVNNVDGKAIDLTPGKKSRSMFLSWANDKKSFFYTSNKRDSKYMDLYEMTIDPFVSKIIFKNNDAFNIGDISNDKRYLSLSKTYTRDNSDVYIYNFETDNLNKILSMETDVNHSSAGFSNDSKYLYYLTDYNSEFKYLNKYNIENGETANVQKEDWDIMQNYFSENGKYRIVTINNDSRTELKIIDTFTDKIINLPKMPIGNISSVNFSPSEKLISFYHGSAKNPNDLYHYDISNKKLFRLTNSMNPVIDKKHLGNAEIIRFNSFDGLEIPAIYYKPPQANLKNKVPSLVRVHGGPGGQARVGYRASTQFLVNNGYAVLDINNRGSSGYGKTFQTLDDQAHSKGDLDDCVAAIDWLKNQSHIDGEKIGILGGSYGG